MSSIKAPDSIEAPSFNLAEKKLEAGVLGKLFGTGDNAAKNSTSLLILLLVIAGISAYFWKGDNGAFFDIVVPIITLGLGYLFGQNVSEMMRK